MEILYITNPWARKLLRSWRRWIAKYLYTINENNITKRMRRSNTAIAGKETRAKLTGKAYVNCWNEVEAWAVQNARASQKQKKSFIKNTSIARSKRSTGSKNMKVKPVNEANTSKTCSLCGEIHEDGRIKRGLFQCSHTEKVINVYLNGAINMMKHTPMSISG